MRIQKFVVPFIVIMLSIASMLSVELQAQTSEETQDELAKQLGCEISYHIVPTKQPKVWSIPEQITVRVVDAEKNPVSEANVCLTVQQKGEPSNYAVEKRENDPKTDQNGTVVISLREYRDASPDEIAITVSKEGDFIPFRYVWRDHPEKTNVTIEVPEEFEVELQPGEMVTYNLVDENGKGIPNANVKAGIRRNSTFTIGMLSHLWISQYETTSDEEGNVLIGPLTPETGRESVQNVVLHHPNYASVKFDKPFGGRDSEKTLEEKSIPLTLTMAPGFSFSGVVVDHEDKPIEGATIYFGAVEFRHRVNDGSEVIKTDAEGRFRLENIRKEKYQISARLPDKYANLVTVDLATVSEPVKIVMKPYKTIRIRAVSEEGETLPKIRVTPHADEGPLFVNEETTRTLEDGTWEWFAVPPEKDITYSVYYDNGEFNEGYHNTRGYISEKSVNQTENVAFVPYRFPVREEPYIVKMIWQDKIDIHLSGPGVGRGVWAVPKKMVFRVLDGNTGLPKAGATVQMQFAGGDSWGYSRVMTEYQTDQNGLVGLDFKDINRKAILFIAFKIEEEGYSAWEFQRSSDPIRGDQRTGAPIPPIIDVLLPRADGLQGIVLDKNRKPIQGAEITVGYSTTVDPETGRVVPYGGVTKKPQSVTNEQGLWFYEAKENAKNNGYRYDTPILIQCPGYVNALMTPAVDKRLQILHAAADVKGRVVDENGNPISGAKVFVENNKWTNDHVAVTDEHGEFFHVLGTTVNDNRVELTAIKEGWTPAKITVDPSAKDAENILVMPPGKPLTIRLKMADGNPLPPVRRVQVTAFSVIVKGASGNVARSASYKIDLQPDKNGVIDWPDAPDVETNYNIIFLEGEYRIKSPDDRFGFSLLLKPRPEEYVFEVIKNER